MPTLELNIQDLLLEKALETGEITLEAEVKEPQSSELENSQLVTADLVSTVKRYRVSLRGIIYDQIEKICKHARSVGSDTVMVQIGPFAFRNEFERHKVHIDFLGVEPCVELYEFKNFIYDAEDTRVVRTSAITDFGQGTWPGDYTIGPSELFERGICGYSISASISDRTDGTADGILVFNSPNKQIAREVHAEVFETLKSLYPNTTEGDNASTTALKQVCDTSPHREHIVFYENK